MWVPQTRPHKEEGVKRRRGRRSRGINKGMVEEEEEEAKEEMEEEEKEEENREKKRRRRRE